MPPGPMVLLNLREKGSVDFRRRGEHIFFSLFRNLFFCLFVSVSVVFFFPGLFFFLFVFLCSERETLLYSETAEQANAGGTDPPSSDPVRRHTLLPAQPYSSSALGLSCEELGQAMPGTTRAEHSLQPPQAL